MQQYAITIEPALITQVDNVIKQTSIYNSRNDFIRESIRCHLRELRKARIDEGFKEIADKIRERGATPRLLTREDREKIFEEFLKEKGFK